MILAICLLLMFIFAIIFLNQNMHPFRKRSEKNLLNKDNRINMSTRSTHIYIWGS